ncbi:hypothetical protein ACH5RR_040531 [Cinchona calisaya]|uniref:Uncharacterized protein n=1 Tax=Cinchona calisaya TaxID=153742 RepID=A0ABD2XUA8_9GENT
MELICSCNNVVKGSSTTSVPLVVPSIFNRKRYEGGHLTMMDGAKSGIGCNGENGVSGLGRAGVKILGKGGIDEVGIYGIKKLGSDRVSREKVREVGVGRASGEGVHGVSVGGASKEGVREIIICGVSEVGNNLVKKDIKFSKDITWGSLLGGAPLNNNLPIDPYEPLGESSTTDSDGTPHGRGYAPLDILWKHMYPDRPPPARASMSKLQFHQSSSYTRLTGMPLSYA